MAVYFDWNATTPVDRRVAEFVMKYMVDEFGNAGSRTHEFGRLAKNAVEHARRQIADFADIDSTNVVFTSGATESNNIAILGLEDHLREMGLMHIISSRAEHKAVLEPIQILESRGFEVTWINPDEFGVHQPDLIGRALKPNTGLVSLMRANNETGVLTDIRTISQLISDSTILHVDCAQSFGKEEFDAVSNADLVSVSGHKLYAPKGVGALLLSDRIRRKKCLRPLMFGGGQERGLRPGTLPVQLIAGLGLAVELAAIELRERTQICNELRDRFIRWADQVGGLVVSGSAETLPNVINLRFPGLDSEFLMLQWKERVAVSNGSACTSQSYSASHVLQAMGMSEDEADECIRFSWSHNQVELITEFPLPST